MDEKFRSTWRNPWYMGCLSEKGYSGILILLFVIRINDLPTSMYDLFVCSYWYVYFTNFVIANDLEPIPLDNWVPCEGEARTPSWMVQKAKLKNKNRLKVNENNHLKNWKKNKPRISTLLNHVNAEDADFSCIYHQFYHLSRWRLASLVLRIKP